MIQQRFEELKLSGNLPSPSGVGLAVLRLTQREDASMEELLWCLQADPALTGRLLQSANVSRSTTEAACTSVVQAARRLGMRHVRNTALEFTLVSSHRAGVCAPFEYDRYWSTSLCTAVAARNLACLLLVMDADEAFTCGLLSRVGMLALASVHPEAYARILTEKARSVDHELCRAEAREFGIDHGEVTAAMLAEWGLSDTHSRSILAATHRDSAQEGQTVELDAIGGIVELSMSIAHVLSLDRERDPAAFDRAWNACVEVARRNGLGSDELLRLCGVVVRQWREWCTFVRLLANEAHGIAPATEGDPAFPSIPEIAEDPCGAGEARAPNAPRPHEATRVLVVDDDEKLARLVAHHLRKAGYAVSTATNGNEALRMTFSESPHIVISDWMMPEMNGLELCDALRKTEGGRKTYVLILTAREDEDRIVDAFNAGADDYIVKPCNPRILMARVRAAQRLVDLQRQVDEDKRTREQQVAELGLLTRKLRSAALTDVLTSLPNRRFAMSRLLEEWEIAQVLNRPLSVVMVDVDDFKPINDTHGHDVGDFVLRATASTLREFTRRSDIVCRLGGEEFLVINVNSDEEGALMCAERLRTAVEANHMDYETFHGHVTISLGVAQRLPAMDNIDALLKAADQAIYAAKAAGRNCSRVAEPGSRVKRSA